VDEPTKHVAAPDRARGAGNGRRVWRREVQAAVGSGPVVLLNVCGEKLFEVASGDHEYVVEAVFSDGFERRA
jgi:hypothetical protein